jgi:hypothetical protein
MVRVSDLNTALMGFTMQSESYLTAENARNGKLPPT